jgi:hypothetical protein
LVKNNQVNCFLTTSGCVWPCAMVQNLTGNKNSLLDASFWPFLTDDSPKHDRCNNYGWFWHPHYVVTCFFSKWRYRPWLCIHFGTVLKLIYFKKYASTKQSKPGQSVGCASFAAKYEVITSMPSKELSAFLDSCKFQFQIIIKNEAKYRTHRALWLFYAPTGRLFVWNALCFFKVLPINRSFRVDEF